MKTFPVVLARWIGDRPGLEVARVLGVSPSTIHYWLNGQSLPPATRIPAIASAIGVGEAKLRQVIARDRASRHAPHDASDPAEAIATNGIVS